MNKLSAMDYWKLMDTLTVFQAIMLMIGENPEKYSSANIERQVESNRPENYTVIKTFLCHAIKNNKIQVMGNYILEEVQGFPIEGSVDIDKTIIIVESLIEFLLAKGINTGFFFSGNKDSRPYMDINNIYYAPKLAAAIHAWSEITENWDDNKGRTPKQLLEKWLRENASAYGLTKDDGSPNEQGILEISKIANWKPEGGATKTPTGKTTSGQVNSNPPTPRKIVNKPNVIEDSSVNLADYIPF